jgi:hypothetical protein
MHRRTGLSAFAAVVALPAYAGAVGLLTGSLRLGDTVAARLPFASPQLGGLALTVIVAAPTTRLAWLAWRGDSRTDAAAVMSGGLVIGWIIVELAFIREFSFFHPTYIVVGGILIWTGRRALAGWPGIFTHPAN